MEKGKLLSTTVKRAGQHKRSIGSVLITLAIFGYLFYYVGKVSEYVEQVKIAISPPNLPKLLNAKETIELNPKGWGKHTNEWFHFASQGTATIPIPYDWFMALEEPVKPWRGVFESISLFVKIAGSESELFTDNYIYRHGFIRPTGESRYNPDRLPIGFTKTPSIHFSGVDRTSDAIGLTCAACHTGQFTHQGTQYIVDGGPAVTDLGLFGKSVAAALGQTALSSKLPIHQARFDRFAARVLGNSNNLITRKRLRDELTDTIKSLGENTDTIKVTEGFTRNDALNRIGNQVFSNDVNRPANYHSITAPVTYPHIWNTTWFDWVQYDGSIMQPLVRNSGEALGVKAFLDTQGPSKQRFASSVNLKQLVAIEQWLGGKPPTSVGNRFNGLQGPKWPDSLPSIDSKKAEAGAALYQELCKGCHLPPINTAEFWSKRHWQRIAYMDAGGAPQCTDDAYLKLKIISIDDIGTDPAQASVLTQRTVDTSEMEIDTQVCVELYPNNDYAKGEECATSNLGLKYVNLNDSATASFGLSLGAVVSRTNAQWFNQNPISEQARKQMMPDRPNCLRVGRGYKARPLNGVWATAPFLHNGSVSSIYQLLSPQAQRDTFIELGNPILDVNHLGVTMSKKVVEKNDKIRANLNSAKSAETPGGANGYNSNGYFILDTRLDGNRNTGHSFEGQHVGYARAGVVGRGLSEFEKQALIEYLKTL